MIQQLLEAIYKYTPQPPPLKVDEYEALLVLLTKAIEGGSDYQLRQAVASAAASILALSQTKAPNPPKEAARRFPLFLMGSAPTPTETSSSSDMRSILSTEEMLAVLAKLINKASSSPQRGTRIALLEAYAALLRQLGVDYIESNYMVITSAILDLGVPAPSTQQSRSGAPPNTNATDAALLTSAARFLLRDCLGKRLSELGQVRAVNELVSNWIQRWPPTGAEQAPSEGTLVLVLDEISALLLDLGPAAASSQDALIDPLAIILAHTSQVVNLALSWTLHCFCRSLPNQLPKLIGKIVSLLQRDTGPANADKLEHMDRIIGYANALAGLLCVVPLRPLYIAYESAAVVFGISTQLLRNANVVSRDSALGATQSLVAWTLVGSLMTLGSQFVKVHISQLLLIWKNCFPKSQGKDLEPRTEVEWNALLINRYAALSALYSFLIHNKDLVTPDIAKRLVVVLNNTLAFLQTLPTSYTAASLPQDFVVSTEAFQMKLVNREALIKVRLMQSYAAIEPSYYDMMGPQLLKLSLEQFLPDPDRMDRFAASMYNPNDKAPLPEVNIANTLIDGYQPMVASNVGADDRGLGNALRYDTDVAPLEALVRPLLRSLNSFSLTNVDGLYGIWSHPL